jgi:hypothetical protein
MHEEKRFFLLTKKMREIQVTGPVTKYPFFFLFSTSVYGSLAKFLK